MNIKEIIKFMADQQVCSTQKHLKMRSTTQIFVGTKTNLIKSHYTPDTYQKI